jgi:hypothetical protein
VEEKIVKEDSSSSGIVPGPISQYAEEIREAGERAIERLPERQLAMQRNLRAAKLTDDLTRSPKPPVVMEEESQTTVESAFAKALGELKMPTPADRKKMKEGDSPFHFDSGKPRMDQIPPRALMEIAKVFGYGARKYGEWNWAEYSNDWKWGQIIGSLLRHTFSWLMSEDIDHESGLHHLAHAGCNVMMLLELVLNGRGGDDRNPIYKKEQD